MIRVYFLGLRGFPDVSGGVETHVENLVLQLRQTGLQLICFGRRRFSRPPHPSGLYKWIWIWAPARKGAEAFVHTFLCVLVLAFRKRGVAHVHGIGPGAFAPALRLLGYKVVVTHHGYDYARSKWGPFASVCLRLGEHLALKFSNDIIAVSKSVATELAVKFNRPIHYIPNGAPKTSAAGTNSTTQGPFFSKPYFLVASRLVPEKQIEDVITAFLMLRRTDVLLIIAGEADVFEKNYENFLREQSMPTPNIQFLGHVSHEVLWRYMSGCLAFINASSHEGLPIAVLEAAVHGAKLVLSNIPAHAEFALPADAYFGVGDINGLATLMKNVLGSDWATESWRMSVGKVSEYSWERIAEQTLRIYFPRENLAI